MSSLAQSFGGWPLGEGTGGIFRDAVPDLPELNSALDALDAFVAEMGEDKRSRGYEGYPFFVEDPPTDAERKRQATLAGAIDARLIEASPLDSRQAVALAGRTIAIIRRAGHCARYPNPFDDIKCLAIEAVYESFATTAAQDGVDRTLHDVLMILAGTLTDARIEQCDPWAERMVELAGAFEEPADQLPDPSRLVEAYLLEATVHPCGIVGAPNIQDLPAGKRILDSHPAIQKVALIESFRVLSDAIIDTEKAYKTERDTTEWCHRSDYILSRTYELAERLLKRHLPHTEPQLAEMIDLMMRPGIDQINRWPVVPVVGAIERHVKKNELGPELRAAVEGLLRAASGRLWDNAEDRLVRLLGKSEKKLMLLHSDLGLAIVDWVNAREASMMQTWIAMLELAIRSGNKGQPTAKWTKDAAPIVAAIGWESLVGQLTAWLEIVRLDPSHPEPNADLIKGLIWAASACDDDRLAPALGRFCEACYKKVPGWGPASVKLGNACIYSFGVMPGERAVAELVRLRSRIKFNQGRKQLEKALAAAAERAGLSVDDLEEMALPDFGLAPDGSLRETLGACTAEIRIAGSDEVALNWLGADGKPRKSVPAAVKADHAEALKALRARVKEIKGLLAGQRYRLESLYLQQRSWPLVDWRRRYLDHPLMANLARRLVWNFGEEGQGVAAIPADDALIDIAGKPLPWPDDATRVSLWHPIDAAPEDVLAWRRRLAALDITQPFKQAHREVYLLTDAERATATYSNRFAAHVLRQHQLNALCQARGWRFNLQGAWDQEESVPTRALPGWELHVEFWTDYISDDITESGVYLYRSSDQVRFSDARRELVRLEDVPALAFSEAMRDVDLFVGVASVGNDPNWQDGGPEGRFRDYWWGYSFGDLGESAQTRRVVLEELVPKLNIADRCTLEDRFLIVRGSKRTYKIHLGSGNILMTPNDQYLCIVSDVRKTAKGAKVRLPFEGDRTLSLILSKAFLLANDDKITDRTILSQIDNKH